MFRMGKVTVTCVKQVSLNLIGGRFGIAADLPSNLEKAMQGDDNS